MLFGLTATACLYWVGWSRLSRVGIGAAVSARQASAFILGILAMAIALISPVAAYSERLFFTHMIQHLLLLPVAPPLLLLGKPLAPLLWGLPTSWRRRLGRLLRPGQPLPRLGHALTMPVVAVTAFVVTVALWHVPAFYDAAQGRTVTHNLEHLMFFGTALLYWWPIVHPAGGRRRLSFAMALPYLLPPFLEGMVIGVLLTFAEQPLYRTYAQMEQPWGFTPVSDQQLGGLIMWIPGGMLFLIPLVGLLAAVLSDEGEPAPTSASSTISQPRW